MACENITKLTEYLDGTEDLFTLDTHKLGISFDTMRLKTDAAPAACTFQVEDDDPLDWIYDSALTEFTATRIEQKSQIPANATLGITYNNDIDGTWGNGVLTGTAFGGADISGGRLDLTGATKYVQYSALNNADSLQTGCIKLKYTPDYSGSPTSSGVLFSISENTINFKNCIALRHNSDGSLYIFLYDENGASIISGTISSWNPTLGVTYEFELNWNITIGRTQLFINGTSTGIVFTQTGVRSGAVNILNIGAFFTGGFLVNGYFEDLIIYDAVQHTANYTAGYTVPEVLYSADTWTHPLRVYPGVPGTPHNCQNFEAVDSANVYYTLNGMWFNGAAWVTSNNSTESNLASEIGTEMALIGNIDTLQIISYVKDSATQMYIDSYTIDYTEDLYQTDDPGVYETLGVYTDGLISISISDILVGSDSIGIIIKVDDINMWYNGSAWATSDGTLSESNTEAQLTNTVIQSLFSNITASTINILVLLHSDDGATSPIINSITLVYSYHPGVIVKPRECVSYGFFYDDENNPLDNLEVTFKLNQNVIYENRLQISQIEITKTTDSTGYLDVCLIENINMEKIKGNKAPVWDIEYTPTGHTEAIKLSVIIPDQDTFNIFSGV